MKFWFCRKRTFDLEGLDREGLVNVPIKEILYRCCTVCSNLSSCFLFFLINFVFKVSVFVLLFSLYIYDVRVREVKADVPLEQRFSYYISDWQNVSSGLTFLFWWRWYYFSSIGARLTCFCRFFSSLEFLNSCFLLPSVTEMNLGSSRWREADQSFVF